MTEPPLHIAVLLAAMLAAIVVAVFTVIVKAFEVAVVETAQAAFEVITQVTISLLAKPVVVNVAPVATGALLILH